MLVQQTVLSTLKDKLPTGVINQIDGLLTGKRSKARLSAEKLEDIRDEASESFEELKEEAAEKFQNRSAALAS